MVFAEKVDTEIKKKKSRYLKIQRNDTSLVNDVRQTAARAVVFV